MRSARIVDLQQQPLLQRLQIPPPTTVRIGCPLTSRWLPARPQTNDDWRAAVDALEGELLSCAVKLTALGSYDGPQAARSGHSPTSAPTIEVAFS